MKDQINTIREALNIALTWPDTKYEHPFIKQALAALSELERMVGEQEPVLVVQHGEICYKSRDDDQSYGMWCPVTPDSDHGLVNSAKLYTAAPLTQQHETVTNDEQAREYMDARLWEFIDMAGMWPKAKPDPRIWAHVMVYAPVAQQPQAETYEQLVDALHRIDSVAVFLPNFQVRHEGGIEAVTQNIVEAIAAACKPQQAEAVPSSDLNPDEGDPVTLWAEIWRLREAVKGPDGYATWQDAATAERIRRVRAESKQAEASALIERMADALRSCSVVPHWPSFQPLINEASKWKAEAVPPGYVLVPLSLLKDSRWRIANLVGSDGAKGADRKVLDALDAAIDAAAIRALKGKP